MVVERTKGDGCQHLRESSHRGNGQNGAHKNFETSIEESIAKWQW